MSTYKHTYSIQYRRHGCLCVPVVVSFDMWTWCTRRTERAFVVKEHLRVRTPVWSVSASRLLLGNPGEPAPVCLSPWSLSELPLPVVLYPSIHQMTHKSPACMVQRAEPITWHIKAEWASYRAAQRPPQGPQQKTYGGEWERRADKKLLTATQRRAKKHKALKHEVCTTILKMALLHLFPDNCPADFHLEKLGEYLSYCRLQYKLQRMQWRTPHLTLMEDFVYTTLSLEKMCKEILTENIVCSDKRRFHL